ncbi:ferritin-like domain-containing protein [Sordaria brevicollis]|uniref:Ferritin-like domain-containing protein n=1 Tax=Sordaria brevicollis TaxID=83679 RepID=A0AAE0UGV5_SORBR|nr:ferritin-like domain-containing protein [Sordaria brevicollis]
MPSFTKTLGLITAGLAALTSALPAAPKLTDNQNKIYSLMKRQNAQAAALGLTDVDILQFALTLELLEEAFYRESFAKFPAADFTALGLSESQIKDLQSIGSTEEAHVILLQSAIAAANVKPVQACTYNFAAVDSAAAMVATAAVLENVGVSAYLGAAQLVADAGILTTAASILSVESRHQTLIRTAAKVVAVPQAFDTPLSPKQVFSLAAPFIASCPEGSNLVLTPFPPLIMGGNGQTVAVAGSEVKLQSSDAAATASAKFCAFTTGGIPGGTSFTAFDAATGGCVVPQGLQGVVYVNLASEGPLTGKLTDDIIVAGPIVMQVS